jgi:flagellum-specific peptidoglycan hydrolase FlgJ
MLGILSSISPLSSYKPTIPLSNTILPCIEPIPIPSVKWLSAKFGTKAHDTLFNEVYNLFKEEGLTDSLSIILSSQAMEETGWGKSFLAKNHFALFGVKCKSGGVIVNDLTKVKGKWVSKPSMFKSYKSFKESVKARVKMIRKEPIPDNYAESPGYKDRIARIASKYL